MQRIEGALFKAAPSLSDGCVTAGGVADGTSAGKMAAKYLLAVSGGVDSMCLAALFQEYFHGRFALAHCNFSLRGEESDGDQALVEAWAAERGVQCFVKRFDTENFAVEKGLSIEMAARDLRYGWFADLCREHGFAAVAVAHNANDNAETLMLNLLRGSGLRGVSGMTEVSRLPVPGTETKLIRPLLGVTRRQIEGWMFARGYGHREDSTNAMSEYKRNRIRNEVFPLFETINPSFVKTLNREMSYFSRADDIVRQWCEEHLPRVMERGGACDRINLTELLQTQNWQYLLYYIAGQYGFNSAVISALTNLLEAGDAVTRSGKIFEAGAYRMLTTSDCILVEPLKEKKKTMELTENDIVVVLRSVGKYLFNGRSISVRIEKWSVEKSPIMPEGVIAFDRAKLDFPIVCRRWEQGDWIQPLGMNGRKKLSDIFTDAHYNLTQKERAIVIAPPYSEKGDPHHVLALLGSRIDDSLKITPTTREVIVIE
ncbi:MAG: tRNA lysidine(34) synthetase TilS [Candidatus Cryptobacteroides sp.]